MFEEGKHLETSNWTNLFKIEKIKKSARLGYDVYKDDMPLTNPADIEEELERQFSISKFNREA